MAILWLLSLLVAVTGLQAARWMVLATDRRAAIEAEISSAVSVVDHAVPASRAERF
jgi:hypothetical protein